MLHVFRNLSDRSTTELIVDYVCILPIVWHDFSSLEGADGVDEHLQIHRIFQMKANRHFWRQLIFSHQSILFAGEGIFILMKS